MAKNLSTERGRRDTSQSRSVPVSTGITSWSDLIRGRAKELVEAAQQVNDRYYVENISILFGRLYHVTVDKLIHAKILMPGAYLREIPDHELNGSVDRLGKIKRYYFIDYREACEIFGAASAQASSPVDNTVTGLNGQATELLNGSEFTAEQLIEVVRGLPKDLTGQELFTAALSSLRHNTLVANVLSQLHEDYTRFFKKTVVPTISKLEEYGFVQEAEDLRARMCHGFRAEADDRYWEHIQKLIESADKRTTTTKYLDRDGTIRWCNSSQELRNQAIESRKGKR